MRFLEHMVQRLYAGLASGPAMNCRPHRSRQRLDLAQIAACCGTTPAAILERLLGDAGKVSLDFELGAPPPRPTGEPTPEARAALLEYQGREATLRKLGVIADDARTYAQDTGAHALQIGLPILNLPPRDATADRRTIDKRVLAPCAFVPVRLTVRTGRRPGLELACAGDGIDRLVPNEALLAWIGQQTGKKLAITFADDEGTAPWRELAELVESIRVAFGLPPVAGVVAPASTPPDPNAAPTAPQPDGSTWAAVPWAAVPRTEDATTPGILPAAVLGLFPLTHQALLDDLEAMAAGEVPLVGPVQSFTRVDVEHPVVRDAGETVLSPGRRTGGERLVCTADPCQARAVELARTSPALVVHGPPGTGKSQTITNIIADHLARGERVLFICDKRTAIDVVHHRLEHLGLGSLCAVVHDAQRDQKELYRDIRDQLDGLGDLQGNAAATAELALRDGEIEGLHAALSAHHRAVSEPTAVGAPSFHALCGEWLSIAPGHPAAESIDGVDPASLVGAHKHVLEVLTRATDRAALASPWRGAAAIGVEAFLAQPASHWRAALDRLALVSTGLDATAPHAVLPLGGPAGPQEIGRRRAAWAQGVAACTGVLQWSQITTWIAADAATRARVRAEIDAASPMIATADAAIDPQLAAAHRTTPWDGAAITSGIAALGEYLRGAEAWYAFFRFGANAAAQAVVARLGLVLSPATARAALQFLEQQRARIAVRALYEDTLGGRGLGTPDASIGPAIAAIRGLVAAMDALDGDPILQADAATIRGALLDPSRASAMQAGLLQQAELGAAIAAMGEVAAQTGLLHEVAVRSLVDDACNRGTIGHRVQAWIDTLPTLEGWLRLEAALAALPSALRPVVWALAESGHTPAVGWEQVRRGVLAGTMAARLRDDPALLAFDGDKLGAYHRRWDLLEAERQTFVRDTVLLRWIGRQRERLLNGSRLSSLGAELKRRLALRGERVMRLRQVIAAGAATDGGDPIFDLRPVWMASPETAAQIFGRAPAFDVIVFDEASQCRLEHALPVLLRGHRVVIAGDPKQLPPTRFFESAGAVDVEAEEGAGDQALFEAQQAGIEDLLAAALNLEVEQCYLDVHYRSTNADLIGFSNEHFYTGRLQAIPNHPANVESTAPVELVQVDGTYADNRNPAEAAKVVEIVRHLLDVAAPPSIGIACFNLTQRELILEALDAAAAQDEAFAERLAVARSRQGAGSFEGLFVKNLENVQGDERDHIIISTTYGRTPEGKFYRRFGPLGQAGGGRRLNVLVTRARQHVHLVTSIPREVYLAEVEVPAGQAPGGGLLLLGYLRWAEALGVRYAGGAAARGERLRVRESKTGSTLARALGERVATGTPHGVDVQWGNDGFCVDLAVSPGDRGGVLGVLCDGSRFDRVVDRVQWDVFRTRVLTGQGWSLLRLTSPQVFRDTAGALASIERTTAERQKPSAPH